MKLIQIHPTLECNLQCSFCSYRDEEKTGTLPFLVIANHLRQAAMLGCKRVKFSGGGEPLLHPHIVSIFYLSKIYGLNIYLQTNGTLLDAAHRFFCDDIRVSHGDGRPFTYERIKPDGYSYVITDEPDYKNLTQLIEYAKLHDLYVRVTFDDTGINTPSPDEVLSHIPSLRVHNGAIAVPVTHKHTLWNNKYSHAGQNPCPSSTETPLVGADGYVYPCCRTQFAFDRKVLGYNKDMRMGTGALPLEPFDGSSCIHCSYDLSN